MDDIEELIQRHITTPYEPLDIDARQEPFIRAKGTPVWVIIGYYLGGHSRAQIATGFDLTEEEVQAAFAYYERHEAEIMERIESSEIHVV
jgi:uncharacterized protein (DUF433 family)